MLHRASRSTPAPAVHHDRIVEPPVDQGHVVTFDRAQVDRLAGDHRRLIAGRSRYWLRPATSSCRRGLPPETHAGVRAAVYVQRLPGDEVRAIARQKRHGRCDVARVADAPPRYQHIAELGRVARHVEVARHFDDTGTDSVYAYMSRRQLDGKRSCESDDGAFGPRVRGMVRESPAAVDRGDVDDGAVSGAFQRGKCGAGTEEIA